MVGKRQGACTGVLGLGRGKWRSTVLCSYLHPYRRASELSWAKVGWREANMLCDLKIKHNTELIKMVRTLILPSLPLDWRGSHLRGEFKTRVKPLVVSMFGFEVPTNDTI